MIRRFVAGPCLALGVSLALSACGNARKVLGLERKAPDEFAVAAHAPLTLPPDYRLRPPAPGEKRPQERRPADQARDAVLGVGGGGTAGMSGRQVALSTGQQALLRAAGADEAVPDIRRIVNRESTILAEKEKSFIDTLVFWRTPQPSGTVVDAGKETQRIRNDQALGKPVGEGETPTIERRERGILEGLF